MKTTAKLLFSTTLLTLMSTNLPAQSFDGGSDGSYGAMNITVNTTLDLPPDGIFRCTTIDIASGATLTFNRNALNTPVYLLAQSNVTINANGFIDVSASSATRTSRGLSGPGGFDGGNPGSDVSGPSAGQGPGGGNPFNSANNTGHGSFEYGSPLLVPLIGGSGGGGRIGGFFVGGGGGGGAILVASNQRIDVFGTIRSWGSGDNLGGSGSFGSGGAIRLVAPVVAGNGVLDVNSGRIRIDGIERSPNIVLNASAAHKSGGAFMTVFPPNAPRLDIVNAAGTAIPLNTSNVVTVQLPFGSDTNRTIAVRAENFNSSVPVKIVLAPAEGNPIQYSTTLDNTGSNPVTNLVNVAIPANVVVKVFVWTE